MPTGYEFTVGTTPITMLRQRGCDLAGSAGRLVAALPRSRSCRAGGSAMPRGDPDDEAAALARAGVAPLGGAPAASVGTVRGVS